MTEGSYLDTRRFRELVCRYCYRPARYQVYPDAYNPSYKLVCEEHRLVPYSKRGDND